MKVMKLKNTLVHLGIAGTIMVGLALTACNEETAAIGGADTAALQERLASAEAEHQTLKDELEKLKQEAIAKRQAADADRKAREAEQEELQKQLRETKREYGELQEAFDTYREEYKVSVRNSAKGRELGNLTLSFGATYTGVVISKWTPDALRVTHTGGNATLAFEELPETIQSVFLYDKAETEELLAKGPEVVTTGRKPTPKPTSAEKWPTKDLNGTSGSVVFTEPEHSGIVNGPEEMTKLDKAIAQYGAIILNGEKQVNELDKKISQAVARGSEGGQQSLERKTERLVEQLQTLRNKRGELLTRRQQVEARVKARRNL
jgi:predicted RNase H-like nuclease (RuvC/YqgF family)